MPVRIYEIARKVGVDSKAVLVKAKELGITNARVPSSTLDKITAEYLLEQLGFHPGALDAPGPIAASAPESAPHPVIIVAAPEPASEPIAEPPSPVAPEAPVEPEPETGAPPIPDPPAEVEILPAATIETAPEPLPPPPFTAVFDEVQPPAVEPDSEPLISEPPAGESAPVEEPAMPPVIEPVSPIAPESVPTPPPPPPEPPKPKLGEKVGFIQLPTRPRPAERPATRVPVRPGTQPAPRIEPARNRDMRPGAPVSRQPVVAGRPVPPRPGAPSPAEALSGEEIIVKPPITVRELAEVLKRKPFQVIADLMELGIFANVNQSLEADVAQRVAARRGVRLRVRKREEGGGVTQKPEPKQATLDLDDKPEDLQPRAPVVTIMGHVDHGKTTLLDVIRKTNVAAGEAGGITQHIGAYTISVPHPERAGEMQQITFLDTPGHAAFSAMRARGANVTDIVILVVAANDGVMPQTLEALNHARAARVPIVVAVNKSDHPAANAMRVRQQLQERGLTPDTWGGDTIFVDVSALTKVGVDKLLEALVVQADLLELRANPNRKAKGNVIESGVEPGGPTATVLVRKGTLRVGDVLLCGKNYGRVRALISEDGKRSKEAGPSVAVRVLGLDGVPNAGIEFDVVENERMARNLSEQREEAEKGEDRQRGPKVRMEDFWRAFQEGSAKVLKVVVKADTQGSVEAIVDALTQIKSDKVSLEIIGDGVGTIAQDDILLASASKAVILGFHTRVDNAAAELAKREGVQIKLYAIIYELIDEVKDAMAGLLDPLLKEVVFGTAQVRKVFALSKGGNVAGCVIASGRVVKGKARLVRRNSTIFEGIIFTLRRFQDEVNEVRAGMECGIRLDGFDDFQEGDTIECYNLEKIPQKL